MSKPKMMKRGEMEISLKNWKEQYMGKVRRGADCEWVEGICVGFLQALGYDNFVDMVFKWKHEAMQAAAIEPEPVRAVCYSAHDVGAEVGLSELPNFGDWSEGALDRLLKKEGWPVNAKGEAYQDMTLDYGEIPF